MMFALGVQFLMDRAVATAWHDREDSEWPPHPDRIFMALVAAFGETGAVEEEATALRWLEQLDHPPHLFASRDVAGREVTTTFVPVNDVADPIQKGKPLVAMGSLPFGRIRQPRHYPAVVPEDPSVFLIWPENSIPEEYRSTLEQLCRKVTYLGHSSSPIQMWVEDNPPEANLYPTTGHAACQLRIFGSGRFDDLCVQFQAGLRPQPSLWQGYGELGSKVQVDTFESTFDEVIVLRQVGGRRWSLESTLQLGEALRQTLMTRLGQTPSPEWLSGHQPDGQPSRQDHLAIVPLGFVGRKHADGHVLGLGLVLPRSIDEECVHQLIDLLSKHDGYPDEDIASDYPFVRLTFGKSGTCDLELDDRPDASKPHTLRPSTYARPACRWTTVTPIVLDRFPRRKLTAEHVITDACERAGLPRPAAVQVGRAPSLPGVPHSKSFPALPRRRTRPQRPFTHAVISFDQLVQGPVLVGAGRYVGYGLCRPFECDYPPIQKEAQQ